MRELGARSRDAVPKLETGINTSSEEFTANRAGTRALVPAKSTKPTCSENQSYLAQNSTKE
jgi:hypothetical protein